jgi:transposase-like protein
MKNQEKKITYLRPRRVFDISIRKQVVKDIEQGKCSVLQASREVGVSYGTVYKWIYKYSRYLKKEKVLIVEEKSNSYRTRELEKRIKELEAALGRKSLEVDFLEEIINLANAELDTDLKKNIGSKRSSDSTSNDTKGTK